MKVDRNASHGVHLNDYSQLKVFVAATGSGILDALLALGDLIFGQRPVPVPIPVRIPSGSGQRGNGGNRRR